MRPIIAAITAAGLLVAGDAAALEKGEVLRTPPALRALLGMQGDLEVLTVLDRLPNGIEAFVALDSKNDAHIPMLLYRLPDGSLFYGMLVSPEGRLLSIEYSRTFQAEADRRLLDLDHAIRITLHPHAPNAALTQRAVIFADMGARGWRLGLSTLARALDRAPWKTAPVEIYLKPIRTATAPALLAWAAAPREWARRVLDFEADFDAWAEGVAQRATNAETGKAGALVRSGERVARNLGIQVSADTLLWHTRQMPDLHTRTPDEVAAFLDDTPRQTRER